MPAMLRRHARALAAGLLLAAGTAQAQYPASPAAGPAFADVLPAPATEPWPPVPECPPATFDWTKVPTNVRPQPRLGYFIPPPEGCAFYTLMDAVRGVRRDRAPAAPFPPISPSPGSFFDADYRFIDSPEYRENDWLDVLKRRRIGENWMFSTGGEFRYRLMDEVGSRLTPVSNNHHLIRTRVYGDLWFRDRLRLYAEFLEGHIFSPDLPPLLVDENPADLLNLFFDLKLFNTFGTPAYLRVGRQELAYGSQRLLSPLDWVNARRTFQGAKLFWTGDEWNVDLFWMRPVVPDAAAVDWSDDAQDFHGVWATKKVRPGTMRDFYMLNLHNRRPDAVGRFGRTSGFWHSTFGTRWVGDHDGRFLYDFEGMIQTGIRVDEPLWAYAATAGLGYRAKRLPWNPTAWLYYDYASGTPDPTVAGAVRTFNQLFPFGHYYLGYQDFVGRQNIHDVNVQVSLNPAAFATILFQYHHFQLASPRDALYGVAGTPIRQDPTGASGTHVGDEFDVLANIHINRHQDVLFGFSMLAPGRFLRDAPGGVPVNPKLYYLQYSYKW